MKKILNKRILKGGVAGSPSASSAAGSASSPNVGVSGSPNAGVASPPGAGIGSLETTGAEYFESFEDLKNRYDTPFINKYINVRITKKNSKYAFTENQYFDDASIKSIAKYINDILTNLFSVTKPKYMKRIMNCRDKFLIRAWDKYIYYFIKALMQKRLQWLIHNYSVQASSYLGETIASAPNFYSDLIEVDQEINMWGQKSTSFAEDDLCSFIEFKIYMFRLQLDKLVTLFPLPDDKNKDRPQRWPEIVNKTVKKLISNKSSSEEVPPQASDESSSEDTNSNVSTPTSSASEVIDQTPEEQEWSRLVDQEQLRLEEEEEQLRLRLEEEEDIRQLQAIFLAQEQARALAEGALLQVQQLAQREFPTSIDLATALQQVGALPPPTGSAQAIQQSAGTINTTTIATLRAQLAASQQAERIAIEKKTTILTQLRQRLAAKVAEEKAAEEKAAKLAKEAAKVAEEEAAQLAKEEAAKLAEEEAAKLADEAAQLAEEAEKVAEEKAAKLAEEEAAKLAAAAKLAKKKAEDEAKVAEEAAKIATHQEQIIKSIETIRDTINTMDDSMKNISEAYTTLSQMNDTVNKINQQHSITQDTRNMLIKYLPMLNKASYTVQTNVQYIQTRSAPLSKCLVTLKQNTSLTVSHKSTIKELEQNIQDINTSAQTYQNRTEHMISGTRAILNTLTAAIPIEEVLKKGILEQDTHVEPRTLTSQLVGGASETTPPRIQLDISDFETTEPGQSSYEVNLRSLSALIGTLDTPINSINLTDDMYKLLKNIIIDYNTLLSHPLIIKLRTLTLTNLIILIFNLATQDDLTFTENMSLTKKVSFIIADQSWNNFKKRTLLKSAIRQGSIPAPPDLIELFFKYIIDIIMINITPIFKSMYPSYKIESNQITNMMGYDGTEKYGQPNSDFTDIIPIDIFIKINSIMKNLEDNYKKLICRIYKIDTIDTQLFLPIQSILNLFLKITLNGIKKSESEKTNYKWSDEENADNYRYDIEANEKEIFTKNINEMPILNIIYFRFLILHLIYLDASRPIVNNFINNINNPLINQAFLLKLNEMITIKHNSNILTYIKIRNDSTERDDWNKRFYLYDNNNNNTLNFLYNNHDISYYDKSTAIVELNTFYRRNTATTNLDVNKYQHNYSFGPFSKIFYPNQNNSIIADEMNETIIVNNLINTTKKAPVLIIGYGASGSGKTSTLIYLKEPSTQGIIIQLCLLMIKQSFVYIEINVNEFYKYTSQTDASTPITQTSDKYYFNAQDNTNYVLTKATDYIFKHNYRIEILNEDNYKFLMDALFDESNKTKINTFISTSGDSISTTLTVQFKVGAHLSNILVFMIDLDRFVKGTTNNPNSSRSHVLLYIKFSKTNFETHSSEQQGHQIVPNISDENYTPLLIIGDLAGVENMFQCDDIKILNKFEVLKKDVKGPEENKPYYYKGISMSDPKEQDSIKIHDEDKKILDRYEIKKGLDRYYNGIKEKIVPVTGDFFSEANTRAHINTESFASYAYYINIEHYQNLIQFINNITPTIIPSNGEYNIDNIELPDSFNNIDTQITTMEIEFTQYVKTTVEAKATAEYEELNKIIGTNEEVSVISYEETSSGTSTPTTTTINVWPLSKILEDFKILLNTCITLHNQITPIMILAPGPDPDPPSTSTPTQESWNDLLSGVKTQDKRIMLIPTTDIQFQQVHTENDYTKTGNFVMKIQRYQQGMSTRKKTRPTITITEVGFLSTNETIQEETIQKFFDQFKTILIYIKNLCCALKYNYVRYFSTANTTSINTIISKCKDIIDWIDAMISICINFSYNGYSIIAETSIRNDNALTRNHMTNSLLLASHTRSTHNTSYIMYTIRSNVFKTFLPIEFNTNPLPAITQNPADPNDPMRWPLPTDQVVYLLDILSYYKFSDNIEKHIPHIPPRDLDRKTEQFNYHRYPIIPSMINAKNTFMKIMWMGCILPTFLNTFNLIFRDFAIFMQNITGQTITFTPTDNTSLLDLKVQADTNSYYTNNPKYIATLLVSRADSLTSLITSSGTQYTNMLSLCITLFSTRANFITAAKISEKMTQDLRMITTIAAYKAASAQYIQFNAAFDDEAYIDLAKFTYNIIYKSTNDTGTYIVPNTDSPFNSALPECYFLNYYWNLKQIKTLPLYTIYTQNNTNLNLFYFIYGMCVINYKITRDAEMILSKMETICNTRKNEGIYINKSLNTIREFIKSLILLKNKGNMEILPNINDKCLKVFCPEKYNCFSNTNNTANKINSEMIEALSTNIKNSNLDESALLISLFCIINLNTKANDPPPVPYININSLKYISTLTMPVVVVDVEKIFPSISSNLTNFLTEFKIINRNNNLNEILYLDSYKYISFYYTCIVENSSNRETIMLDGAREISADYLLNNPIGAIEDLILFCRALYDILDNSNAVTTVGTIEFMDRVAKYYLIDKLCIIADSSTIIHNPHDFGFKRGDLLAKMISPSVLSSSGGGIHNYLSHTNNKQKYLKYKQKYINLQNLIFKLNKYTKK